MIKPKGTMFVSLIVALVIVVPFVSAQETKQSPTGSSKAGMDPERLARITARMKEFVEKGTIAGAVMLVARHGEVAYLEALGYQDLETRKPMRTDTIFVTRSMQKSITAVGIMILVEEGRLLLTDPVEKHLPEFRDQVVIDKRDGDKVLTTQKPSRPITIHDLLTHTSGVPREPLYREPFKSWPKRDKTLTEVVALYAREPLEFEPGTRQLYSDAGFSILARIIEVASGQAYQDFLEQRILRPLAMKDTFYFVPPEKDGRIASAYRLENGHLTKVALSGTDIKIDPFSAPVPLFRRGTKFVSGAWGWFSTATDMFAFYQMMLNGGTYNRRRILSRASVELMTTVHTGDLRLSTTYPGFGYGLGWYVFRDPLGVSLQLRSIGSYGHGGAQGTFGWVDPERDLVGIFMMHRRPLSPNPERGAFIAMAAAAIVDDEKSKPKKNDAGMDPERLARIPARMKEFFEKGTIAGAVTLVARHGEVVSLEAVGYQDLETKKPMRTDTIFNIFSMTKSLTAVGIMILLEEGRLTLSDPVEKYLPEFRDQMMVERREGDKVVTTKKPSRAITIRDLLTHTSGMHPEARLERFSATKTAAENVTMFAKELTLEFEPGTKYLYSNWGFIMLGRIIEVVSGKPYEEFVEQRVIRPLGMKDTFYFPPPEKCDRIASRYDVKDGTLTKDQIERCRKRSKNVFTAGGWLSTAADLFAFYQMMLNGGTYQGVRILSRASVEAMTTLHTGDLPALVVPGPWPTPPVPTRPNFGYGLGWYIIGEPPAAPALALASIGSYGHAGHGGTFAWVDPKNDLVGVFLIQRHFGPKPGHGPERWTFMAMANAAIADDVKSTR